MRVAARFVFQRLALLDRLVRDGQYPNAQTLADRLEVSRRTILRDLDFARHRLGWPLDFDPRRRGYFFTDATFRLSFTALTAADLEAFRTAELALEPFAGLPDGADLARVRDKVAQGLLDPPPANEAASRSFRFSTESRADPERFVALHAAIRDRRRGRMRYYSASRDAEGDRDVDPYHLVSIDGRWFLVAFCHERGEVRMFNAGRVRAWATTDEAFDPPVAFNIRGYLGRSLGMLRGRDDEAYAVRLLFSGKAVRYVRELTWHPGQRSGATADGSWLVEFEVSHLREAERLALSWGADCLVLGPPELRDRVARTLARAAALYVPEPSASAPTPSDEPCR